MATIWAVLVQLPKKGKALPNLIRVYMYSTYDRLSTFPRPKVQTKQNPRARTREHTTVVNSSVELPLSSRPHARRQCLRLSLKLFRLGRRSLTDDLCDLRQVVAVILATLVVVSLVA